MLVDGAFTIASADNVDFLQSNAAVYSGRQHRSWHATSIQLVQPMPQMAIYNDSALTTSMNSEGEISPIISTSVLLPSSQALNAKGRPDPIKQLHALLSRNQTERSSPTSSPQRLTRSPLVKKLKRGRTFAEAMKLNDVNPQIEEQMAFDTLSNTLFKYIVIKESCLPHNILADVKFFCGMALPNIPDIQCSNIGYMSIVD